MLSFFSHAKLQAAWSYQSSGHLWRILFGEKGHIVGEVRDHDAKRVSFFCLQEATGAPLWEHYTMTEPWWLGIEAVHGDTLILHGFHKPDLPEHRRIFVLDLDTGRQRWVNEDLTFWFAYRGKIYAHQTLFEKRVGYVLAIETGDVLETHNNGIEDLFAVRRLAQEEDYSELFLFPNVFEKAHGSAIAESLLSKHLKRKQIAGNVEYVQKEPFLLYNYHLQTSEKELENHFVILETRRGRELFSDVLAQGVPAPVPDSFFLRDSTVYYVKGRNTLVSLPLPDQSSGGS